MEPPAAKYATQSTELLLLQESTSAQEAESSSSSPGTWASKRKRTQVTPHNVIAIDEDDDPASVIFGENNKHKQAMAFEDWQIHMKDVFFKDLSGSSTFHGSEIDTSLELEPPKGSEAEADYDYADDYEFGDAYEYEENDFDEYEDDIDYNYSLAAKFDDLDLPPGVEATVPWLQKPAPEELSKGKQKAVLIDEIDIKFEHFKQFDTVQDHSDHHYLKPDNVHAISVVKKPSKEWAKRIQQEWKVLEKDLPETIFVRVYEERMDLLRAVIVGPAGTPYHDGLFFFDAIFPANYPNVPPRVHYHSGGLRLNPNLYNCGKVCLSLLGTWTGSGCENWNPEKSTMLQVLVSIQALVLNAKPYFNEPGYASTADTPFGERKSSAYNKEAFLLSCKTMLYSLQRPPRNFEDFVAGHFRKQGHTILAACRAYMEGAQVGSVIKKDAQYANEGDKSVPQFKTNLKKLFEDLLMEFTVKGADCKEFLDQKVKAGAAKMAADTLFFEDVEAGQPSGADFGDFPAQKVKAGASKVAAGTTLFQKVENGAAKVPMGAIFFKNVEAGTAKGAAVDTTLKL